jgi:hypothetical protein
VRSEKHERVERVTSFPRREFLFRALAVCATAGLGPARLVDAAQSNQPGRVASTSAAYFGDRAAEVRAFGEAYLRMLGRDSDVESVRAASRGTLDVIDRSRDQPGAIRALVRAVQRDFEQGRVVQVEGWILSKTEAELCAISLVTE